MSRFREEGGALRTHDPYIRRQADIKLFDRLSTGHYCYVLAPRQSGKSSLRQRVAAQIETDGIAKCVHIDMTKIAAVRGSSDEDVAADEIRMYRCSMELISDELGLSKDLEAAIARAAERMRALAPAMVWTQFIVRDVLSRFEGKIVIFVDELEALSRIRSATGGLIAAIRSLANDRSQESALERVTFCLLGVVPRGELQSEAAVTPLNIGDDISLEDFTRAQMNGFRRHIEDICDEPKALLDAIFDWTHGHPWMTQWFLARFETMQPLGVSYEQWAASLGDGELQTMSRRDPRVGYSARFIEGDENDAARDSNARALSALTVYRRLLDHAEVDFNPAHPDHAFLYFSGVAAPRQRGHDARMRLLKIRNRIYGSVYDRTWLDDTETLLTVGHRSNRWIANDRDPKSLLMGRDLDQTIAWVDQHSVRSPEIFEFLFASTGAQRRKESKRSETKIGSLQEARTEALNQETKARNDLDAERARSREQQDRAQAKEKRLVEDVSQHKRVLRRRGWSIVGLLVLALGLSVFAVSSSWQHKNVMTELTNSKDKEIGSIETQLEIVKNNLETEKNNLKNERAWSKQLDQEKSSLEEKLSKLQIKHSGVESELKLARDALDPFLAHLKKIGLSVASQKVAEQIVGELNDVRQEFQTIQSVLSKAGYRRSDGIAANVEALAHRASQSRGLLDRLATKATTGTDHVQAIDVAEVALAALADIRTKLNLPANRDVVAEIVELNATRAKHTNAVTYLREHAGTLKDDTLQNALERVLKERQQAKKAQSEAESRASANKQALSSMEGKLNRTVAACHQTEERVKEKEETIKRLQEQLLAVSCPSQTAPAGLPDDGPATPDERPGP